MKWIFNISPDNSKQTHDTMNPELMNDIKTRYEGFVATDKGQAHTKKAKEIQAQATALLKQFEKDPSHGQTTTTKGVRREYLPEVLHKAKLVRIVPIGLNNCCFQNAEWLEEEFGFKRIFGFNIVGCRCGGRMCFEIHALNRTASGELIDITRDFCDETEKWFVPFENEDFNNEIYRLMFGQDMVCFEPSCRCCSKTKRWNNKQFVWTETEERFEKVWKLIHNEGGQYWTKE